ncbi:MAG: C-terminal binding protein [Acetobacteraceae bacterium]|nr:C-terminal binding protein [Acetobacteraceae bacterium]
MTTILYPERMYADDVEERRIFGEDVRIWMRDARVIADLPDEECAEVDGLMLFRQWLGAADLARFPKLRAIVRMGVGYDRIDRATAAGRNVIVCNVPDYGTTEVADHAIALALALRRGLLVHHEQQRADPPAPWVATNFPLLRRTGSQSFGVVGLGRIGTATALRAKALGFKVGFFDPYRSNGTELALGIGRAATLEELLRQSDVLSLHVPATPETRGMIGAAALALLPQDAIVVNTARGTNLDLDALAAALRAGRLAGAGLDVVPVEPPVEPVPELLRAYRAREPWLEGRLIVTPHSAYLSPEAHRDIRIKSAETMRAALFTNRPQNVIAPDMY